MKAYYINDINEKFDFEPCSAVIGNFDGLHLGHRNLINQAKMPNLKTLVISFQGLNKGNGFLSSTKQKEELISELDVDYLIVLNYSRVQMIFFHEFIKFLRKLKVKVVTCGPDFRFGYKREGDLFDLEKYFRVNVVNYVNYEGIRVSSSAIKELLADGYLDTANKLLARPYSITGTVFAGNRVGRTLGFPTANIDYSSYFLPKKGVYFVEVILDGTHYYGMANIGFNPTINLQEKRRLEVHILDFDADIYGQSITVVFKKFIRDEKKFDSRNDLIAALNETVSICRKLISETIN